MSGKGRDYRPITDNWLLAPSKIKYWGSYPSGFLQRARDLLCRMDEPLLHVCSGRVREYPGYGVGPYDRTLDINPALEPDFCQDARQPWLQPGFGNWAKVRWPAILMDPPYTKADAAQYQQYCKVQPPEAPPWGTIKMAEVLPTCKELLTRAWEVLRPGGKVGLLHQFHPKWSPQDARLVAIIQVIQGCGQQPRCFSVWEKEFKG